MRQIIAISGCGGGNEGPQGIYPQLKSSFLGDNVSVLPLDTLPNDIEKNVQKVKALALKVQGQGDLYLMGYSMGGAVAAQAAYELNQTKEGTVKGVVLLNSQTDGLQLLKDLKIPVLFYRGKEDQVVPSWQAEGPYNKYSGPKKLVELEGLDHGFKKHKSFGRYKESLAQDLQSEINEFFFTGPNQNQSGQTSKSITANENWLVKVLNKLVN